MSKRPKPTTPKIEQSNTFLDALKFIGLVTKEAGTPYEVHSLLSNNTITAHNGIIGAGHKITEEIYAAPNNHLLVQALSKCGEHFSITNLENHRLSIKSNKFKAIVPCIDPVLLQGIAYVPDNPSCEINSSFIEALSAVGAIHGEASSEIVTNSILMNNGSLIASDGKIIIEYWHGLSLPYGAAIPKAIVAPLTKTSKKLIKFGYSQSSITFWYEDDSWFKSQIYAEPWPRIAGLLDKPSNPFPIPADFWNGVAAVAPFSPNGALHFKAGMLASHGETGVGATFDVARLPSGPIFSTKLLALMKPHAEKVDFLVDGGRLLMFHGAKCRGLIAGMGTSE